MPFAGQFLRTPFDLIHYGIMGSILDRKHILIACMPKSGSTYLSNAVSRLPNFRKATLVQAYGRSEQELSRPQALRKHRYNYVAQHHVKYNENTEFVLDKFHITPVVLVRNIFDCVASIRDHIRNESVMSPTAWIDETARAYDDDKLSSMIAQLVIPWYINFYVSWTHCPGALLLTYEEAFKDISATVSKICDHVGIELSVSVVKASLEVKTKKPDRFNVGISGRGDALDESVKNTIRQYATFYPHIDFSPIGLNSQMQP
jgi:hypothetical protein